MMKAAIIKAPDSELGKTILELLPTNVPAGFEPGDLEQRRKEEAKKTRSPIRARLIPEAAESWTKAFTKGFRGVVAQSYFAKWKFELPVLFKYLDEKTQKCLEDGFPKDILLVTN